MQATEGKIFDNNRELISLAQGEDKEAAMAALEKLIEINNGLVKTIALRFRDRGVEFEDLMQIGTMGMLKAIRSFDLERGTTFSTYAVPLIFGEIRRHIRDEGPIKVSRYYKKLGATLINLRNTIFAKEGREARIEELASLALSLEINDTDRIADLTALWEKKHPFISLSTEESKEQSIEDLLSSLSVFSKKRNRDEFENTRALLVNAFLALASFETFSIHDIF